ncbi:LamG-like jellyroll fold domain-containing protein [Saccharicrinis sp. FJH54]|uniref:LamG-like jellyroll fold domain-containing protein n=1 Tax=Saccharicrinis sp. FJH54 TaxID=3344665 RepID=UPI0035D4596F
MKIILTFVSFIIILYSNNANAQEDLYEIHFDDVLAFKEAQTNLKNVLENEDDINAILQGVDDVTSVATLVSSEIPRLLELEVPEIGKTFAKSHEIIQLISIGYKFRDGINSEEEAIDFGITMSKLGIAKVGALYPPFAVFALAINTVLELGWAFYEDISAAFKEMQDYFDAIILPYNKGELVTLIPGASYKRLAFPFWPQPYDYWANVRYHRMPWGNRPDEQNYLYYNMYHNKIKDKVLVAFWGDIFGFEGLYSQTGTVFDEKTRRIIAYVIFKSDAGEISKIQFYEQSNKQGLVSINGFFGFIEFSPSLLENVDIENFAVGYCFQERESLIPFVNYSDWNIVDKLLTNMPISNYMNSLLPFQVLEASTNKVNGITNGDVINIQFNKPVNISSINNSNLYFQPNIDYEFHFSNSNLNIEVKPIGILPDNENINLILKNNIEDENGTSLYIVNSDTVHYSFNVSSFLPNFYSNNTIGSIPLIINFYDNSVVDNGIIENRIWDFGDGTTSNLINPSHTYAEVGTYDISLTISDGVNNYTETKEKYITVTAPVYGHDLKLYLPHIEKDWLTSGEDLDFYCDVKNVGEHDESDYLLKFQLLNENGEVLEEETEQGVEIPVGQLSSANSNRTLSIASGYPEGFYTFKITVVFPDDYAQGDNSQEFSVFIGDANPYLTYKMASNDIQINTGQTKTIAGHSVLLSALDKEMARVYLDGTSTPVHLDKNEFNFFDAFRLNLIYKSYVSSSEGWFRYATPSTEVSFSPQTLTIEAGKTGTFNVVSNEEDPTPNIAVTTEGGLDASILQNWTTKAYTKGTPYTNVYFDITVPSSAERRLYDFWVNMSANGAFYQKLNIEVIDPQPDFNYSLSKNSITIAPNMSEQLSLDLTPLNGFNENIVFSFMDLPTGITITPSENNISIPQTIQLKIDIDENFSAFDNYIIELDMVSGTKSKAQNLYINVIDNSKNFLSITDLKYIDKDSKHDSLEIFYNSQFEYAETSITTNWQYTINGTDWIDISTDQILNNGAKEVGDNSIIWNIQDAPILFSKTAKFRMKNKNGSDFLTYMGYNNYIGSDYFDANPDYCGIAIKDNVMYLVDNDESPMLIRKWDIKTNEYLGSHTISQVATTHDVQLISCYNRFYIYSYGLDKVYYYSSNFTYLGSRNVSTDIDNMFEMEGKLYGFYFNDVALLKELNSTAAETGNNISATTLYNQTGSFYDGKNLWLGYNDHFYKYSEDFSSITKYTFPRDLVHSYYYDGILYGTNGDYEIYKISFYDPFSFYAESSEFELNNSYNPICDSVIVISSKEDSTISSALDLAALVSDLDTPIEDLNFTLVNIDTNITVAFNADTTNLSINPATNWYGTSSFYIRIQDDYNTIESKVIINVSPVNDAPVLQNIDYLLCNEDDSLLIKLDMILSDIDNSFNTLDFELGVIYDLNFNCYLDTTNHAVIIKPFSNYFCDSSLAYIKVTDSSGLEAIDTFYIEVKAINDVPTDFSKLSPFENLCQSQGYILFNWTNSEDVEGDSIFYILNISTNKFDTIFLTNDTLIGIDISLFNLQNDEYSDIYWDVFAYDGENFSSSGPVKKVLISNGQKEIFLNRSICQGESIQIGDSEFSESGAYTVIFENQYGCDSIVYLNLLVNIPDEMYIKKNIDPGESVQIGDSEYSETGIYKVTLLNQYGCDSIIHLDLMINSSTYSEYLFDESGGTSVFDSHDSNDGTIVNSVSRLDGIRGGGLEFNGSSYIDLGHVFSENIRDQFTLSAWVLPADTGGWQSIIMHGGPEVDTYGLYLKPESKEIGFKTSGTTEEWLGTDGVDALWDGNWHLLTAVYDGSQKLIYLDTNVIASNNVSGKITSGNGYNLLVGSGWYEDSPDILYKGSMDETRIYNYALSRINIDSLYDLINLQTTYSEYLFDESDGTTVFDSHDSNDGTIVNSVSRLEGIRGGGLEFNGSGYVNLGHVFSENIRDQFTLSAWVIPADTGGWQSIIMHGGPEVDTYGLYLKPESKEIGFKTSGTTEEWLGTDGVDALWDGNWHLLTAVYDGSQKLIYLDTNVIASNNVSGKITSGNGYNLLVGSGWYEDSTDLLYKGSMDEARIYNYALANTVIDELYDSTEAYHYSFEAKAMTAGGSASVDKILAYYGVDVTFTITTEAGYSIDSVIYNGENVTAELSDGIFIVFANESGNLYAYFKQDINSNQDISSSEIIQIFPNPNKGQFTITWNYKYESGLLFKIYDMKGQLFDVKKTGSELRELELNLMNEQRGLYLIEIVDINYSSLVRRLKVSVL